MEQAPGKKKCPKCKKGYLDYRTPRALWVKALLFWLPIRRYRCGYCDKKTYVLGDVNTGAASLDTKLKAVKNGD